MKRTLTLLIIIMGVAGGGVSASANAWQDAIARQEAAERQRSADVRHQDRINSTASSRQSILGRNTGMGTGTPGRNVSWGWGGFNFPPRKLTKENRKYLEPSAADYRKYEGFLMQPNTGLIKLLPDLGCRKSKVIDASSPCLVNNSLPGDGAAYSFRKKTHIEIELSDLLFKDGKFQIEGDLTQGVIFKLGTLPIETVSLASKGMKFLTDFMPAKKLKDYLAQKDELKSGVKYDDFIYGTEQPLVENMTYGLRSVAYRGSSWIDERRDVVIVFQTVSVQDDGSVVIVWKQLQNIKSPRMKR